MKYIILTGLVLIAFIIYQRMKTVKAARRRREDAKNRAILQEILDARR
ncbi:MAG: hypothetical protein JSS96_02660 [Bacteroidetes bacterium]|nr:hypothetical protein [Bacteroidota bacterium]